MHTARVTAMRDLASDVHHYARRLELALSGLSQNRLVTTQNKETIQSYVKFRDPEGLGVPRKVNEKKENPSLLLGGRSF